MSAQDEEDREVHTSVAVSNVSATAAARKKKVLQAPLKHPSVSSQSVTTGSRGVYNTAAGKLLDSIPLRPLDDKLTSGDQILPQDYTLRDAIEEIQKKHSENLMTDHEYKAALDSLLGDLLAGMKGRNGQELALCRAEAEALYPQLFESKLTSTSAELMQQEESHRRMHVSHVLPVVQAIGGGAKESMDANASALPKNFSYNIHKMETWQDFVEVLTTTYDQAPLLFPQTVVCSIATKLGDFIKLLESRSVSWNSQPAIDCGQENQEKLLAFIQSFARAGCSIFKPTNRYFANAGESLVENVARTRRGLKILFHRPEQATRHVVLEMLVSLNSVIDQLKTSEAIETSTTNNQSSRAYNIIERLFFKPSLTSPVLFCHVVSTIAKEWVGDSKVEAPGVTSTQVEMRIESTAPIKCARCERQIRGLCISDGINWAGNSMCPACAPHPKKDEIYSLRLNDSVPVGTSNALPSAHLLAHKSNLYDTKLGTRHLVLPDNSRVVMTTSVREGQSYARDPESVISPITQNQGLPESAGASDLAPKTFFGKMKNEENSEAAKSQMASPAQSVPPCTTTPPASACLATKSELKNADRDTTPRQEISPRSQSTIPINTGGASASASQSDARSSQSASASSEEKSEAEESDEEIILDASIRQESLTAENAPCQETSASALTPKPGESDPEAKSHDDDNSSDARESTDGALPACPDEQFTKISQIPTSEIHNDDEEEEEEEEVPAPPAKKLQAVPQRESPQKEDLKQADDGQSLPRKQAHSPKAIHQQQARYEKLKSLDPNPNTFFKPTKSAQLRMEAIKAERAKERTVLPSLRRTEVLARDHANTISPKKSPSRSPGMPSPTSPLLVPSGAKTTPQRALGSSASMMTPPLARSRTDGLLKRASSINPTSSKTQAFTPPTDEKKKQLLERRRAQMKRPGFTAPQSIAPATPQAERFLAGSNTRRN